MRTSYLPVSRTLPATFLSLACALGPASWAADAHAQPVPGVAQPPLGVAGQLQPPPPMTTVPAASEPTAQETQAKLDEAEKKDSGRNFELFYVDVSPGVSYLNMAQFSAEKLGMENTSSTGPAASLGLGLRLVILTLGARARYNSFSAYNLWQLNGEVGFKIPVSKVDILIGMHGGYSFVGSLANAGLAGASSVPTDADAVKIRGFNGGLDVAVDYYLTPLFSIGAGVMGDFLYLKRPPIPKPASFASLPPEAQAEVNNNPLYAQSGTTAGMQITGGLRLGLHFGL